MLVLLIIKNLHRLLYVNYLSLGFFASNWDVFFSEEVYNISVLTSIGNYFSNNYRLQEFSV